MYVGLYLCEPWHWSTCHPRCFAACSVSMDLLLPERFCCWSRYIDNGEKDVLKSSWPTMDTFAKHWYRSHCSDHMWQWQLVADELSLTFAELAFKMFGTNLGRPLPSWPESIRILPKSLPDKQWSEHNERIYGSPWDVEKVFTPNFAPRPPKGPPPSHLFLSRHRHRQPSCTLPPVRRRNIVLMGTMPLALQLLQAVLPTICLTTQSQCAAASQELL